MSAESLLLRYSGDPAAARAALGEPRTISISELSGSAAWSAASCRHLGVLGGPPAQEIGSGLAPLLAARARPAEVTEFDHSTGGARRRGLGRYLAVQLPAAAMQLATSSAAVGSQAAAARVLRRPARLAPPSPMLRRVCYVRALVGVPAAVGGAITHTHEVIRALRSLGVDVATITTDPSIARTAADDPDPPCRWDVVEIPAAFKAVPASAAVGGDLALVRAAVAAARSADVVYQRHTRFALAGAMLARLARRPLFLEYNGSEAFFSDQWQPTPFRRQLLACEDAMLASAARIVVVSDAERALLVERGIDQGKIVVSPNGVDASRFAPPGGGDAVRRRLGVEKSDFVIGFAGSFGPWHGATVLADAYSRIADALPRARLLLVGEGPEEPAVRERLSSFDGRVLFAGKVAPAEVPSYLDACDVLASPHVPLPGGTEFFGSPTKLFEYKAAGKAIVASRLGQIADVLEDGVSAVMVEPGDASELAAAIERLADDPAERARLGERARQEAFERHSWRHSASTVIDSYAALAAERGSR